MDSALALLKAIEARLKADADIQALVGDSPGTRVYGAVPANPTYPFMFITCSSEPFDADDMEGMEHQLRVQCFERENKPATVLKMRKAVYAALNRQEALIVPEEGNLVLIDFNGTADAFPEPDGRTYQSFIEFKVLMN